VTAVTELVEVFFDLPATGGSTGDLFTLNDATNGQLGTGVLGGIIEDDPTAVTGIPTDISEYCYSIDVNRGRSRQLDEMQAGTLSIGIRNYDARFLPWALQLTESVLLDQEGNVLLDQEGEALLDQYGSVFGEGNISPGRRVRYSVDGVVVFDGLIEDWNFAYSSNLEVDANLEAVDALGVLALKSFVEWTTDAGDMPGERINAVLDRGEVAFPANRDIDDGVASLQADLVTWGSNVLNYLQLVAQSEVGRLFASRTNTLTFRDRISLVNPTVKVAFADDAADGTVAFSEATIAYGSELLYTRVQCDRIGGTAQTANDTTKQERYGVRTLAIGGLLNDSDDQCLGMANYLLGIYKEPQARISSLSVVLESLTFNERLGVIALDIGDVVTCRWTPRGWPSEIEQTLVVEGVSHSTYFDSTHLVTLALTPLVGSGSVFVLNDPDLGLLGSGVLSF
jgi:hypothetical protein